MEHGVRGSESHPPRAKMLQRHCRGCGGVTRADLAAAAASLAAQVATAPTTPTLRRRRLLPRPCGSAGHLSLTAFRAAATAACQSQSRRIATSNAAAHRGSGDRDVDVHDADASYGVGGGGGGRREPRVIMRTGRPFAVDGRLVGLADAEAQHLARVLRMRAGARVWVADGRTGAADETPAEVAARVRAACSDDVRIGGGVGVGTVDGVAPFGSAIDAVWSPRGAWVPAVLERLGRTQ
ncbi:hypothetical protein HK405_001943, partial [Cladochytrium tenue]